MLPTLPLLPDEAAARPADDDAGLGCLVTERGNLPLVAVDVDARITGLVTATTVRQTFVNRHDTALEATYVFPLPDRAAVRAFRMEVAGRVVEGQLRERGAARQAYDQAIAEGRRAAIAEEDRPSVFSVRVGNLAPGEEAVVELAMTAPLACSDGEATYRFPLVVAPRYIPGAPLGGPQVGDGTADDTDAVPDASRISPPVLLPGFPNPVRLAVTIAIDPAGLPFGEVACSLPATVQDGDGEGEGEVEGEEGGGSGGRVVRLQPAQRLDRDLVLRIAVGAAAVTTALVVEPGEEGGTFALTLVPPAGPAAERPRDVVLVLDRSGSMGGWKMVAARRALARMVDALTDTDRVGVLAFDTVIETPPSLGSGLVAATDRNRFRAVEFLAGTDARGGTDLAAPLARALDELGGPDPDRDRLLVLVTDGQVGNEDQILRSLGTRLDGIRVFTVGIDTAVNEGFLRRFAALGGGACELVESEDRLDDVMTRIQRRLGTPVRTDLRLQAAGLDLDADTLSPARLPDLLAGVPVVVTGRFRGAATGGIQVSTLDVLGMAHSEVVPAVARAGDALTATWARGRVRDLEDRYAAGRGSHELAATIVATSLRFGVLCRFTAFVAIDTVEVRDDHGVLHRVTQPVEMPHGWAEPIHDSMAAMPVMAAAPAQFLGYAANMAAPSMPMAAGRARGGRRRNLAQESGSGPAPIQVVAADLAVYRRRANELADSLASGLDDTAALTVAVRALTELIDDLRSVGAPAAAVDALVAVRDLLAAAAPSASQRDRTAARDSATTALREFGGTRRTFWR